MAGAGTHVPVCLQTAVTEGRSRITNALLTAMPSQYSMAKASPAIQYIMGFDSWQVALLAAGCLNANLIWEKLEYLEFCFAKHLLGIHIREI